MGKDIDGSSDNTIANIGWFYPVLILVVYLASLLLFFKMGVMFDASTISWYWQFLDIDILKTDLFRGLYYQHSQPPLFNLFAGSIMKIFPQYYEYIFSAVFHFCGLIIYFLMFRILCLKKIHCTLAFSLATIFINLPQSVLFGNLLFYTWPVAALLTYAAYSLLLYEKTLDVRKAALFLISIGIICLTRSMFHILYLLVAVALICSIPSPRSKYVKLCSMTIVLIILSLYGKNFILFGFFGSSSWVGMNLSRVAPSCEGCAPVADPGVTSVPSFSLLSQYPESYLKVPETYSGVNVLTEVTKGNGHVNFNHYGYVKISSEYMKEAVNLIKNNPYGYLKKVQCAWEIYCTSAWDTPFFNLNRKKLQPHIDLILPGYSWYKSSKLSIMIPWLMVVLFGGVSLTKFIVFRGTVHKDVFLWFIVFSIMYVAVVGNAFEIGENARFRITTDALLFVGFFCLMRELWDKCVLKEPPPAKNVNKRALGLSSL